MIKAQNGIDYAYTCLINTLIMAKPITETPILKGKDAANFVANQQNYDRVPISDTERERMRQNYEKIQSLVVTNVSR